VEKGHEPLQQADVRMPEACARHQVVDGPLVDAGERAGCDEGGERREGAGE